MAERGLPQHRAEAVKEFFTEEQSVEGDGFSERHADDGLDEDFDRSARIAADGFDGFGADETDAKGGTETAEGALDATGDISDNEVVHVLVGFCFLVSAVRTQGTLPAGK